MSWRSSSSPSLRPHRECCLYHYPFGLVSLTLYITLLSIGCCYTTTEAFFIPETTTTRTTITTMKTKPTLPVHPTFCSSSSSSSSFSFSISSFAVEKSSCLHHYRPSDALPLKLKSHSNHHNDDNTDQNSNKAVNSYLQNKNKNVIDLSSSTTIIGRAKASRSRLSGIQRRASKFSFDSTEEEKAKSGEESIMNQQDLRPTSFGFGGNRMKRMSTIDKLYSIKSKKGTQEEGMPTTTVTNKNILPKINPTKHDLATGRDPYRVKIFDTTLRDGEQSPGCTMTADEKIQVAKQLRRLGVDIIEAGFPIASVGDFEAVSNIAKTVGTGKNPPIICGLARALKNDIETCWNAVKHASFPRIHTFIATSDIHMEHKLKKTREEVLEITKEMVSYARSLCEDVEFSAEDALRSDPEFLYEVYSVAVEAGATTLNVPDTVGYTTPNEFYNLIHGLRANVKGIDSGDVTISVHGHDDLGMAVANFMSAIEGGARQVECTINGIGERAGNAALEEIVMALQVRKPFYNPNFGRDPEDERSLTNIKTNEIYKSSRLVSTLTGMVIQPNKAIVGANAFAHESGIHQDGILKNKSTYEIMDAASIGLQDQELVLGKHSGRAAFRSRLNDLGFESLSDTEMNKAFLRFKEVADKKKEITNSDIISIVNDEIRTSIYDTDDKYYEVTRVQVICGDTNLPTATVGILDKTALVNNAMTSATNNNKNNKKNNEEEEEEEEEEESGEDDDEPKPVEKITVSTGTGPVDAAFRAVSKATNVKKVKLLEFSVSSVTAGIDAIGEVTVRVKDDTTGKIYFGRAANTDIVVSATTAYVNALNRLKSKRDNIETHPQFGKV